MPFYDYEAANEQSLRRSTRLVRNRNQKKCPLAKSHLMTAASRVACRADLRPWLLLGASGGKGGLNWGRDPPIAPSRAAARRWLREAADHQKKAVRATNNNS